MCSSLRRIVHCSYGKFYNTQYTYDSRESTIIFYFTRTKRFRNVDGQPVSDKAWGGGVSDCCGRVIWGGKLNFFKTIFNIDNE